MTYDGLQVPDMEPRAGKPWAFIAVMGVTGAGKSTFIRSASGAGEIEIGHGLQSCTISLQGYSFHHNGYNVNLIDTPGFNDTFKSETDVLQDIADWLKVLYSENNKLSGIIYLHSVQNVRMEGSALRNLKMFRKLCGDESLKNVLLVTSFWGTVEQNIALRREEELRTMPEFWGEMLRRGSRMERFGDSRPSALRIIESLMEKPPVTLEIQRELVDQAKALIETEAGQTVNEELAGLEAKHKTERQKVQEEMREALKERDEELQRILEEQQDKLDKEIGRVHQQQEQLKADRRAEERRWKNELEARTLAFEEQLKAQEWSFEQALSLVRANESKLRIQDRELLESKIKELSKSPEIKQSKAEKFGRVLAGALELVFPATTLAVLGVPLPFPFSESMFGRGNQGVGP